ncbi:MAG: transposase [Sedimentisphaerales bacterium]|nr:transposase [Sedimentisphaerales bacterium]
MKEQLNKTLTFGLGKPLGWDIRGKAFIDPTEDQRREIYISLRATSRISAQMVNMLNAREYVRRIMKIPEAFVNEFKGSYIPIKQELKTLGLEEVDDISGATLSQTWALGVKPDFAGEHGKRLLMKGDRQLPTHRIDGTHPIYGRADGTKIILHEDRYFLIVQLFSSKWANKNEFPSGWIAFPVKIKPRDKTLAGQFKRIIDGEWKLKNSHILRNPRKRGNTWLGQVVVSYTPDPFKDIDPKIIMGIDLGVSVPACLHIRENGKAKKWAMQVGRGRDMLNTRGIIRSEIVRIIRSLRSKDSPLDNESKRAAKAKLKNLRKREKRVMKTASQKIAASIADVARRNGAGTWKMELLSENIKDEDPWLRRNWAPRMVVDAVRWQAEQVGAKLEFVDPAYTSQRCSKCGHISRENRPKGKKGAAHFECVRCGYKDHADKNAARNISTPGIVDLIKEQISKSPNGEER